MKQGSADDPFADDSEDEATAETEESVVSEPEESEPATEVATASGSRDRSLPYIHARDGVKDGRTQRPVFLRDHVESGIDELVAEMEAELGTDVYKTDVTEAAMVVAQEHPELVREKLDEWGYGWA